MKTDLLNVQSWNTNTITAMDIMTAINMNDNIHPHGQTLSPSTTGLLWLWLRLVSE